MLTDLSCWSHHGRSHADPDLAVDYHSGFFKCVEAAAPSIEHVLDLCIGNEEGWTVAITGHSMGAALALLFTYRLAGCAASVCADNLQATRIARSLSRTGLACMLARDIVRIHAAITAQKIRRLHANAVQTCARSCAYLPDPHAACRSGRSRTISLTTFACPRTGNQFFRAELARRVPDLWRIFNQHDIVAMWPEWYAHAGNGVLITKAGSLKMLDAQRVSFHGALLQQAQQRGHAAGWHFDGKTDGSGVRQNAGAMLRMAAPHSHAAYLSSYLQLLKLALASDTCARWQGVQQLCRAVEAAQGMLKTAADEVKIEEGSWSVARARHNAKGAVRWAVAHAKGLTSATTRVWPVRRDQAELVRQASLRRLASI